MKTNEDRVIGGNDTVEFVSIPEYGSNSNRKVVTHNRELFDSRAQTCVGLIERWGMIAGKPDGEDSSGRSKYALATPRETVERAVEMVDEMMSAFADKGWIVNVPSFEDCTKE